MFDVCFTSWSYFKSIKFRWVSFRLFFFVVVILFFFFVWHHIFVGILFLSVDSIAYFIHFQQFMCTVLYYALLCSARRAFSIIFPIPFACYCCFSCHQNLYFCLSVCVFSFLLSDGKMLANAIWDGGGKKKEWYSCRRCFCYLQSVILNMSNVCEFGCVRKCERMYSSSTLYIITKLAAINHFCCCYWCWLFILVLLLSSMQGRYENWKYAF